ncbi:methionyl-tRNA formyltransferase [Candidatus Peregrinibacteria bacterium]|nr:methionyl-tRNA formyltransferase [Candidatus Peregrinibacteria bacterium]
MNKKSKLKIVFMGTPSLACPVLEALINDKRTTVEAVLTQPDKPVGRKQKIQATPIKLIANKYNIPVYQPITLKKSEKIKSQLKKIKPDFFVVLAYGQILDQETLSIPKIAPINIHGSLLPKYRGASPVVETLLHGDQETGITIMEMNHKMDEGEIYQQYKIPISEYDNTQTLYQKLATKAAQIIVDSLEEIAKGMCQKKPQDHSKASYCHKLNKKDGEVFFEFEDAKSIIQKLKAFFPWPGVYFKKNNKIYKIIEAKKSNKNTKPGEFIIKDNKLYVGCSNSSLEIIKIQPENKSVMDISDFIRGYGAVIT